MASSINFNKAAENQDSIQHIHTRKSGATRINIHYEKLVIINAELWQVQRVNINHMTVRHERIC